MIDAFLHCTNFFRLLKLLTAGYLFPHLWTNHVSIHLSSLTARLSVLVFLKARLSEACRCLTVVLVGHPRPSHSGTGVPWVYRGCPAWTHLCGSESRMTLRQRANPLSSWVESCCSVMVVFVFVVVVEVVRSAFVYVTENTYKPARLEALFKLSVVLLLSHLFRVIRAIQTICTTRTIQIFQISEGASTRFSAACVPTTRHLVRDLIGLFLLLSAVSQSILFAQMQICSTSRRLINIERCRVCPSISMQSSRQRVSRCWLFCEQIRRFYECQVSKELVNHNGCCVSA